MDHLSVFQPIAALVINHLFKFIRAVAFVPPRFNCFAVPSCRVLEALPGFLIKIVDYFPVWDRVGLLLDKFFFIKIGIIKTGIIKTGNYSAFISYGF